MLSIFYFRASRDFINVWITSAIREFLFYKSREFYIWIYNTYNMLCNKKPVLRKKFFFITSAGIYKSPPRPLFSFFFSSKFLLLKRIQNLLLYFPLSYIIIFQHPKTNERRKKINIFFLKNQKETLYIKKKRTFSLLTK